MIKLRKILHENAEPSMREVNTKQILWDWLSANTSLEIFDRDTWFFARKRGSGDRAAIAFRCDFDGVLCGDGKSRHLCGHDGHSAALAGLAKSLEGKEFDRDIYFLFQPGEETGEGAKLCCELVNEKQIGEIYGFHNIPGYRKHEVILLDHTFACASTGMEIRFAGRESHAAYPEQGVNPSMAIAKLIAYMDELVNMEHRGIVLGTVIGMEAGSCSYGISAGDGALRLTLRAEFQNEYDAFTSGMEERAQKLAREYGLSCEIVRIEEFPATTNDVDCVNKIRAAADQLGLATIVPEEPFRWSEDFGHYLQRTKGAFLGIGCGENHAGLHTAEYEFEDEILDTAIAVFEKLI